MNDPLEMTAAYLEGKLNAAQVAELEAYLREDPKRARAFVRQAMLDSHLTELLHEQNVVEVAIDFSDDSQFGALLKALDAPEGAAKLVDLTEKHKRERKQKTEKNPNEPTAQDYINAGRYVLRMALTSKPAKKLYTWSAVAAVLLLALILFNPFASDAPDTIADLDFWDDADTSTPPAIAPGITAVATLTATHDAAWGGPASAGLTNGDTLAAGTRLTLTAGFAEITTHDGAIAILEAPATVELLDHNNAIRLHAGKLVGICETDASKGFTVRTPRMDVVDLGTRFGVVVQEQGNTLAQVFDGKVVVTPKTQSGIAAEPIELVGGEAHAVDTAGQAIALQRFDADAFTVLRLAGSGIVSLTGDADLAPNTIADSDTAAARAKRVTVYQELRGHRLASAIGLTFATPGRHNDFKETRSSVPAGTVIRTYILWHPNTGDESLTRGSVSFEGEVLGAVANERDWQAFVDATSSDAGQVCTSGRHAALESVPAGSQNPNEQFTLSDDRKTLQFQFRSGPTDALRIIVREPAGEQP